MQPEDLRPATYRGVEFFVTASRIAGGRKVVVKDIPNSDRRIVEDLGLLPRSFTLRGSVAERRDNAGNVIRTYQESRDLFVEALERGGPGVLVHPFHGEIENVFVRSFDLGEEVTGLGDAPVTVTFEQGTSDGVPIRARRAITELTEDRDAALDAIEADVVDRFSVTLGFAGNFEDALDKVGEVVEKVDEATSPLAAAADEIDAFNLRLSDLSADAAALVTAPVDLADSIRGTLDAIGGLYPAADGALTAFVNLFDFGDDDVSIPPTTSGRVERQRNRDALNASIRAGSLASAYVEAARVEYETVAEIEAQVDVLEAQYQKIFDGSAAAGDVIDALTDLRAVAQAFFDEQKLNARRVIEVETTPTSARLLAFLYYGSSDQGEAIAELNGLGDSSLLSGTVKILTA